MAALASRATSGMAGALAWPFFAPVSFSAPVTRPAVPAQDPCHSWSCDGGDLPYKEGERAGLRDHFGCMDSSLAGLTPFGRHDVDCRSE